MTKWMKPLQTWIRVTWNSSNRFIVTIIVYYFLVGVYFAYCVNMLWKWFSNCIFYCLFIYSQLTCLCIIEHIPCKYLSSINFQTVKLDTFTYLTITKQYYMGADYFRAFHSSSPIQSTGQCWMEVIFLFSWLSSKFTFLDGYLNHRVNKSV